MRRTSARVAVLGVLAGWALTGLPARGPAQEGKAESVVIKTVDGVELHGKFYPTGKTNLPTVLMLHALGKDSRSADWQGLAEALNKKGYAVLTFDFRGHGNSTKVDPKAFWGNTLNSQAVRGFNPAKLKDIIDYKDFKSNAGYTPYLINDVAAAKMFLDRKNNAGACNTHSLVLVGAESGAALGATWLRSEWLRYGIQNSATGPIANKDAEGKNVIAAVWLSPTPYIGSQSQALDYRSAFNLPGLKTTPMVFAFGDGDASAKNVSKACESFLKADKKSPAYKYFFAFEVKGAKKLRGSDLLKDSLGLGDRLVEYVDQLAENKTSDHAEQNFGTTPYAWIMPGSLRPIPVNLQNGQIPFTNYMMFVPR
jgi:pimeloyl-ACP methyl ester carboxylesterase